MCRHESDTIVAQVNRLCYKACMKSLISITILLFCTATFASDWPQFRGPRRDGVSDEKDWLKEWPAEGPKRLWKADVGVGPSSVSIQNGMLYTMGHTAESDTVYCLNAETGAEVWKFSYACETFDNMHEGGPAVTPTIDGPSVYTLSRAGQLYCFDALTGKVRWNVEFSKLHGSVPMFGYTGSPLLLGDKVIASVGGPGISRVAFDKTTGRILWKTGDDDASYSSPLTIQITGRPYVVIFNASGLIVVDPINGHEQSRHEWVTPSPLNSRINAATPLVVGLNVFIASGYGKGCALLEIGERVPHKVWANESLRPQYSSPVYYNGYLYGFDSNPDGSDRQGELKCLDFKSGEEKWARPNPALGTLLAADGKLLILSRRGELILAEATPVKYMELARTQVLGGTCRAEPVLCNGRIYIRSVNGELVCLDVRK